MIDIVIVLTLGSVCGLVTGTVLVLTGLDSWHTLLVVALGAAMLGFAGYIVLVGVMYRTCRRSGDRPTTFFDRPL